MTVEEIEEAKLRKECDDLYEKLMEVEEHLKNGARTYSIEEVDALLDEIINGNTAL